MLLTRGVQLFLTAASDVGLVTLSGRSPTAGPIVISFIQAQLLGVLLARLWSFDHNRRQGRCQQLGIVDVGSGNHDTQGAARASHKQTPLDASLAPIRRVGPDQVPPKRALPVVPSTACQCQSTPPNASHSCIRTPQVRRKTPDASQR